MHRLFAPVIAPLIEVLEPRVIVEIGSGDGRLTRRVLEATSPGAVLHAVDPALCLDADLVAQAGDALVLHPDRAIAALPQIGAVDLALLDGDPNYHAVLSSLEMLVRAADRAERPAPLVVVHNIHWPFGRRDGYYDPSSIPPGRLHEHTNLGLVPGRRDSRPDGLMLTPFCAVKDFLPRSGVLTAIDDLIADSDIEWTFLEVPGFHGVGLLAEARLLAERPGFAAALRDLKSSRFLGEQARRAESARVEAEVELAALRGEPVSVDPVATDALEQEEETAVQSESESALDLASAPLLVQVAEFRAQKEALEWRLGRLEEDLVSRTGRLEELELDRSTERRALVETQVRLERAIEDLRAGSDAVTKLEGRVADLQGQLEDSQGQLAEVGERERLAQGRLAHSEDELGAVTEDRNRLRAQIEGLQVELRAAGARLDEIAEHLAQARSTRRARLGRRLAAIGRAAAFRRQAPTDHLEAARTAAERRLPSSVSPAAEATTDRDTSVVDADLQRHR